MLLETYCAQSSACIIGQGLDLSLQAEQNKFILDMYCKCITVLGSYSLALTLPSSYIGGLTGIPCQLRISGTVEPIDRSDRGQWR